MTPLQLAHMTAMLAERGKSFQPRVVMGVRDAAGRIIRNAPVAAPGTKGISDASWGLVLRGMIGATTYGTAAAISKDARYSDCRQDRHRAGVHGGAKRQVQRQHRRRTIARSCLVHRLCAGRGTAHRYLRAGGERRLRRHGRRADRPRVMDAYLLEDDAPASLDAGRIPTKPTTKP